MLVTAPGEPGSLHIRVPAARFADWAARLAGLLLPAPFAGLARAGSRDGDSPPPAVAGSLAIHALAEVSAELQYRGDREQVHACVAILGGLAGTLACRRGPLGDVVEVGLAPADATAAELLRWLPDVPPGTSATARVAVGCVLAGSMRCYVEELHAADGCWCRRPPDRRPEPLDATALRTDLADVLLDCRILADPSLDDPSLDDPGYVVDGEGRDGG